VARGTIGSMTQQQVEVPPRYARVTAWVISPDTDAEVRFLTSVFGAVETPGSRMLDPDGDIGHVEVEIGDSVIMLFDAKPGWPPTRAYLRVYVADVAHLWWLHERVEDVALDELANRFADPAAQEAMAYVQSSLREELETARSVWQ
jgi:PhnB protein